MTTEEKLAAALLREKALLSSNETNRKSLIKYNADQEKRVKDIHSHYQSMSLWRFIWMKINN